MCCVCMFVYVCEGARLYQCLYVCVSACLYLPIWLQFTSVYLCTCMYLHVCSSLYILNVCMCLCVCILHICMCTLGVTYVTFHCNMDFAVPSSVFSRIRINMLHCGSEAMQLKVSTCSHRTKATFGFLVKSNFVQRNMWKLSKVPSLQVWVQYVRSGHLSNPY